MSDIGGWSSPPQLTMLPCQLNCVQHEDSSVFQFIVLFSCVFQLRSTQSITASVDTSLAPHPSNHAPLLDLRACPARTRPTLASLRAPDARVMPRHNATSWRASPVVIEAWSGGFSNCERPVTSRRERNLKGTPTDWSIPLQIITGQKCVPKLIYRYIVSLKYTQVRVLYWPYFCNRISFFKNGWLMGKYKIGSCSKIGRGGGLRENYKSESGKCRHTEYKYMYRYVYIYVCTCMYTISKKIPVHVPWYFYPRHNLTILTDICTCTAPSFMFVYWA